MPRKKPSNGVVPYTKAETSVIQKVFDSIPVADLQAALVDSGDERAVALAERLSDSAYSRTNLASHCFSLKLLPKDVWNILIDSRKLEAKLKLTGGLTQVIDAVLDAAIPQVIDCLRCTGRGWNPPKKKGDERSECQMCGGNGKILKPADKESQKMALEMSEMLGQKVPLVDQRQVHLHGPQGSGGVPIPDMTDWTRNTDRTFDERDTNTASVVEAEVVD